MFSSSDNNMKLYHFKKKNIILIKEEKEFHTKVKTPLFNELYLYSLYRNVKDLFLQMVYCGLIIFPNSRRVLKSYPQPIDYKQKFNSSPSQFIIFVHFDMNPQISTEKLH